jgi:hypothetical protein
MELVMPDIEPLNLRRSWPEYWKESTPQEKWIDRMWGPVS